MEKKKSGLFKNTLILVIITLVAVAALAVVNQITREPIEQAEINQKAEAYKVVYADATEFGEVDGLDKMIENQQNFLTKTVLQAVLLPMLLKLNHQTATQRATSLLQLHQTATAVKFRLQSVSRTIRLQASL